MNKNGIFKLNQFDFHFPIVGSIKSSVCINRLGLSLPLLTLHLQEAQRLPIA